MVDVNSRECSLVQVVLVDWRALGLEGTRAHEVQSLQSSCPASSNVRLLV